jgi:hypothetical protein
MQARKDLERKVQEALDQEKSRATENLKARRPLDCNRACCG